MSDTLIDGHVSTQQCKRAVDALLSHATKHQQEKAETQLLPDKEQNVWLVVNTKVMHPEKKIKPARIPVKYPIVDPRTTPICLITKDPQREYKDRIAAENIKFISRVVDIRHLKGKWKPYEARRLLLRENGLFLADERVVPLLPGLLGKIFFKAKKQPIPVCITRKDLKGELERAVSSTYFHQNQGTCTSVKVGNVSQKPTQVLANLQTAVPEIVKHIKGGWDNVQSMFIKTNRSAALPLWQCDLGADAGGRWDGLLASLSDGEDAEMDNAEESGSDEDEEREVEPAVEVKGKGKKRAAEAVEEKPKKKAKGSDEKPSVVEAPPAAKGKAKAAAAAVDVPAPTQSKAKAAAIEPATSASEPAKKKRRKSQAEADPAPAAAPASPAAPEADKPSEPAKKEKRKKARASLAAAAAAAEPSDAAPTPAKSDSHPAPAASTDPVTPSVAKKKRRASAVDFFDEAAAKASPAPAAAPPNTPADGLAGETPAKRKKRSKGVVADTPVTTAIAKLAAQPEPEAGTVAETPSGKKPRKRKQKEADVGAGGEPEPAPTKAADVVVEGAAVEKKRKRKHKDTEAAVEEQATPAAPTLTSEEMKQKRSSAGGEKKKEKVLGGKPAAKSAKDEVVGKRSKKL